LTAHSPQYRLDGGRGDARGGGLRGGFYPQGFTGIYPQVYPQGVFTDIWPDIYEFQDRALEFQRRMEAAGGRIRFHSYYRGRDEQEALFLQKATKAHYGMSPHNYGLAIDFAFVPYGYNVPKSWWEFAAQEADRVGLLSGIGFGDAGHIESRGWRTWIPYISQLV